MQHKKNVEAQDLPIFTFTIVSSGPVHTKSIKQYNKVPGQFCPSAAGEKMSLSYYVFMQVSSATVQRPHNNKGLMKWFGHCIYIFVPWSDIFLYETGRWVAWSHSSDVSCRDNPLWLKVAVCVDFHSSQWHHLISILVQECSALDNVRSMILKNP